MLHKRFTILTLAAWHVALVTHFAGFRSQSDRLPARPGVRRAARLLTLLSALTMVGATTSVPDALAEAGGPTYPARQVRLVVPFPPGGGSDIQARILAENLGRLWKQGVVVENVSGAGGGLAASTVARSNADGYTIFFSTSAILAVNPFLYKKLTYRPVEDFIPVVKLSEATLVLLVPGASPFRSVSELVKAAKEKPGSINFGSGGVGTTQHLAGELLEQSAGIQLTHVPYRGDAQTLTALMTNDIQLFFDNVQSATTHAKGGQVRSLAIASRKRLPSLPDLPAVNETIPGFEAAVSYGLLVPTGTPADVVEVINRDVNKVLRDPAYAARMTAEGVSVEGGTPEQFSQFLAAERSKWGALVKRLNLKLD